ncbi:MAG: lysylphosphatidylglycerol synthase transmembrane domain-containing protein [Dehalococcoidia bacterium]|nr:lysylphosphatidylglycerol synthase transmembrane domain-containing protein [Dehalococcoidia bacterium]
MLKNLRFWLGIAVTLVFLFFALRNVHFSDVGRALREANYIFILPALAAYFIGVWFRALRWRFLLKPLRSVSANRLFPTVVIGYLANNVLPLRAGEVVRAYILGEQQRLSKMSILGTIVVERIFDGLALLFFVVVVMLLPFVAMPDWLQTLAKLAAVVFVGALAFLFIVALSEKRTQRLVAIVVRFLPHRLGDQVAGMATRFVQGFGVLQSPLNLAAVFGTSVLVWLFEATMYFTMGYAFNLNQPFYVILLATAAANLLLTVPSSSGGIGPFEFATKTTLVLFGTAESVAITYAILLHAVLLIPVSLLGFFFLWQANLSLAKMISSKDRPAPLPVPAREDKP